MADDDFSPALGGEKAQPEPPPPPPVDEPADAAPRRRPAPTEDEIPPELAALLGPFARLAEIFQEGATSRPPAARTPGTTGVGDEAAEAIAREVEAFMGGAIREISQRLPATLAALNGLVDAVEQAITPLVDDLGQAIDAAAARGAQPAAPEIVDAVDAVDGVDAAEATSAAGEAEIPPVDLPPNA